MLIGILPKAKAEGQQHLFLRQPSAVCSCRTHGQSCVLILRGRPLDLVLPTRLQLWFFTWNNPPAARRATSVQRASNPGPAKGEAGPPTRPDAHFPRVISMESETTMASLHRPSSEISSGTPKSPRFGVVPRGRCTHRLTPTRSLSPPPHSAALASLPSLARMH